MHQIQQSRCVHLSRTKEVQSVVRRSQLDVYAATIHHASRLRNCLARRRWEQTFRSWLHWLVVDVPGGADPAKGRTLTQYKGPSPPKGVHRCVPARAAAGASGLQRGSLRSLTRLPIAQLCLPSLQAAGGVRRQAFAAGAARAQQLQRACPWSAALEPGLPMLTPQPSSFPGSRLRGRQQAAGPGWRHLL